MSALSIALLQMRPANSQNEALTKGDEWCRRAAAQGADLALFPELWDVGYRLPWPGDVEAEGRWADQATPPDGPFVGHFRHLAKELGMAIAVTYLERTSGKPRNSVALIDRHGAIVFTYAKVHTCEWGSEAVFQPGDGFYVGELDTASVGPVQVGAMICYDREQPESARILMLKGAEIILTPNACTLEKHRLAQFSTRAFENMVGLAMTNYAAPAQNGSSMAVDGMAFARDESGRDMLIAMGGTDEELVMARFDLLALRRYRQNEVWANAYRQPRLYDALAQRTVAPPFVRPRQG
jgi:predicted amidohydrolase